jgi:hypothetical protein
MTTAQFLPRTPTEVMFAAVIALKAYSTRRAGQLWEERVVLWVDGEVRIGEGQRTDLV